MQSMVSGGSQLEATSEEHWTTDEDAMDTPGLTRIPNSPVPQQGPQPSRVLSEPARLAAEAVMNTYLSYYVGRDESGLGPFN